MRPLIFAALPNLAACVPQIGNLERGEEARVVRSYNGDTLELDNGLRFSWPRSTRRLARRIAQRRPKANWKRKRCIARLLLAYGGARRWTGRAREYGTTNEASIAQVFVKSEGGRWTWLQHELVSRGGAFVRPRRDNHARAEELIALKAQAREAERGMWARRAHRPLSVRAATEQTLAANANCLRGAAPYRVLEGRVAEARVFQSRAALTMEGSSEEAPFTLVVFGENFGTWDGPALASLTGARVRARGPIGV